VLESVINELQPEKSYQLVSRVDRSYDERLKLPYFWDN
jgi:hypothetical protein